MAELSVALPTFDFRRGIRRWGDDGNGGLGDCVPAMVSHIEMVHNVAAASSWKKLVYKTGFVVPGTTTTVADYDAYLASVGLAPGPDQGVAPYGYLQWLQAQGKIKDCQDIQDLSEASVCAASVTWIGAGLILCLTARAYNHFYSSEPLDVLPGDKPDPALWHEVALVQHGENYGVVSWGRMKMMTPLFLNTCIRALDVFV